MPTVSVIVPNYNHAPYLQQRIDTILNQTYQDFELILLDDCSTDNSQNILLDYKNHPKVTHIVFNERNSGSPFAQWNRGINLAKGTYVWIAESDDWAEPEFLQTLMTLINEHHNVVLAYSLARYIDKEKKEAWKIEQSGNVIFYQGEDFIHKYLLYANVIYNVSMTLFRKDIFAKINQDLYNKMQLCGDWFFYTMLCEHGNVLKIEKALSNYRMHETNTSKRAEREGKSFLEGLDILDYICEQNRTIKSTEYSFMWAKQWVKYKKKFQFETTVNRLIKKRVWKRYKLMLVYYFLYNIYYSLKNPINL